MEGSRMGQTTIWAVVFDRFTPLCDCASTPPFHESAGLNNRHPNKKISKFFPCPSPSTHPHLDGDVRDRTDWLADVNPADIIRLLKFSPLLFFISNAEEKVKFVKFFFFFFVLLLLLSFIVILFSGW